MPTWMPYVTLAIAVLGAGLGALNTWNSIKDRRVRLRVTPQWSLGAGFSGMSIEVTNLGATPVTLTEVGFTIGKAKSSLPKRVPVLPAGIMNGPELPTRLDRREAASITFSVAGLEGYDIRLAYGRTADGTIAYGSSGALEQFVQGGCKPI